MLQLGPQLRYFGVRVVALGAPIPTFGAQSATIGAPIETLWGPSCSTCAPISYIRGPNSYTWGPKCYKWGPKVSQLGPRCVSTFGLEIFFICYLHKEDFLPRISLQKYKNAIFGSVLKLAAMKTFPQLPMLVDC
jgi:hypothetical protein